jgi:hypothetical protein
LAFITAVEAHSAHPINNGTHAPWGTFFNAAPQNKASTKPKNPKNPKLRIIGFPLTQKICIARSDDVTINTVATENLNVTVLDQIRAWIYARN